MARKMSKEEEFDIFYVDMNRLEEQAAEHSYLYIQFCKDLKDAKQDAVRLKAKLGLVSAELALRIGRKPAKYNLDDKPTKQQVADTVLTRPKYKAALKEYEEAQDLVAALQIYVNGFDHRKRMISKAVDLHGQAYFSRPHVSSSQIREVVEQLEKRVSRDKTKKKKNKNRS